MARRQRTTRIGLAGVAFAACAAVLPCRGEFPCDPPEPPAPNYFDFWNLEGRPPASDPWQVLGELRPPPKRNLFLGPADPRTALAEVVTPPGPEDFTGLMKRLASAEVSPGAYNPWSASGLRRDPGRLTAKQEARLALLESQAKFDLPDLEKIRSDPLAPRNWKAEETVRVTLPVASDSIFVFGSFDSSGDSFDNQSMTIVGKTGVGWQWSPLPKHELQLRGGPVVTYADPYNPVRYQETSEVQVEWLAKVPVIGDLQLQYRGAAIPALLPTERDRVNQDLRLSLPIGPGSEFRLGAKYRWEYAPTPSPWLERTQLYLGLELKR